MLNCFLSCVYYIKCFSECQALSLEKFRKGGDECAHLSDDDASLPKDSTKEIVERDGEGEYDDFLHAYIIPSVWPNVKPLACVFLGFLGT